MSMTLHYMVRSVEDAVGQLWTLFGWTFLLSWAMWHTSQGMRKLGSKWLGMGYFYLVAPGVACHETGHLMGCWLTRSKVTEYVPFRPQPDGNLGWVNHLVSNTMLGRASLFVTGTGPIWFGGVVALFLSWMLTGVGPREMFGEVPGAGGGPVEYMLAVKMGALGLAGRVFSPGAWRGGWTGVVWAYLLVCVTSEITLSGKDLESVWAGLAAIAILVLTGNCVPGVDAFLATAMKHLQGPLYYLHSTLAFTLALSTGFYILVRMADFALELAGAGKRKV